MKKPSVLCVTLNPCLDKTLTVPAWKPGDNVRGTAIREVVGGKGNNVARALKGLGQSARPATFLGGSTGSRCELLLKRDDGMEPLVIASSAETRTILTVRTGETAEQSAFFDPDPAISAHEADLMLEAIRLEIQSGHVQALTLSGSSPSVSTHRLYGDLIRLAKESGITVLLDTYGKAFTNLNAASPDVIQLNRKEVAGILGLQSDELSEPLIFDWLKGWVEKGTRLAVLTQGPESCSPEDSGREPDRQRRLLSGRFDIRLNEVRICSISIKICCRLRCRKCLRLGCRSHLYRTGGAMDFSNSCPSTGRILRRFATTRF